MVVEIDDAGSFGGEILFVLGDDGVGGGGVVVCGCEEEGLGGGLVECIDYGLVVRGWGRDWGRDIGCCVAGCVGSLSFGRWG